MSQTRSSPAGQAITHPDKVLFPGHGITKGDLASYYEAIAPVMLPHVKGRPVTMERFPAGIGEPGFIQKDVSKGFPAWLKRAEVPKKGGVVRHALITDVRSLLWVVNQNTITPHVWTSRAPAVMQPDVCVFDLDPAPDDDDLDRLRAAALAVRGLLEAVGLPSWIKTSGSKGFHIVVPVRPSAGNEGFTAAGWFAQRVGAELVRRDPGGLTQEFSKADRGGRIYVDTARNGYSATFAAAYAVRAKPGAPVSAPCTWDEVERGEVEPRTFTLQTMADRIAKVGDLWAEMPRRRRSLPTAVKRLEALGGRGL